MKDFFARHKKNKLPCPHKEESEYGKAKKGIIICRECFSSFYKKSWHRGLNVALGKNSKIFSIHYGICPACAMIKNREFEGRVTIEGIPRHIRGDLMSLINSFCERAYRRDSQHRLINIEETGSQNLVVTTTENQLAVKLGKKIKDVFKKLSMRFTYSRVPSDITYVRIKFAITGS